MVGDANKYLSDQAPWKIKDDPSRLGTILHVALQVVSDCNTLLTPFLPHSAQKIHELLGGTGVHAPMPEIREVEDLDGGPGYPVITGDYTVGARWESVPIEAGRALAPPKPVFKKLDPSIVDEELARLGRLIAVTRVAKRVRARRDRGARRSPRRPAPTPRRCRARRTRRPGADHRCPGSGRHSRSRSPAALGPTTVHGTPRQVAYTGPAGQRVDRVAGRPGLASTRNSCGGSASAS